MPSSEYMAGSVSGALGVVVGHPMDTVKVRLQVHTQYNGIFDCVAKTFANEGSMASSREWRDRVQGKGRSRSARLRGRLFLWTSGVVIIAPVDLVNPEDVPCYGLYFLPYELVKAGPHGARNTVGDLRRADGRGTAGVVTWACATPMDVVKARLQLSGAGGRHYRGVAHCILVSAREEGPRVFFRGLLLNSARAFPVNAITFLSYESLARALRGG
ncbi:unnamed protein product [Gadus morhua 'NCC']